MKKNLNETDPIDVLDNLVLDKWNNLEMSFHQSCPAIKWYQKDHLD